MFSKIKLYEQRYRELNEYRLAKAQELLDEKGRFFFNLVPLMLHLNNYAVPCAETGDVPHGICNFRPNEAQRRILDGYAEANGSPVGVQTAEESILGLYCMGSTASAGQSPSSDFDYWVCVSEYMPEERIALLKRKCRRVREMAAGDEYRLDVNFFIVKTDRFRRNPAAGPGIRTAPEPGAANIDEDDCGTALHRFLLDEFYRSVICVAGKMPVWMIVPCEHESDYAEYVKELYRQRVISRDEWLDLGPVGDIPSNEYYGTALWLMYKGIDFPFKASIKILLMEIYSAEYPHAGLVSVSMKEWMHNNEGYGPKLDGYRAVFDKISAFLRGHNDYERLEHLRICFFLKISEGVARISDPAARAAREAMIAELVGSWGWTEEEVRRYNNPGTWNIVDVVRTYHRVFNVMLTSYRALLAFGTKYRVADAISYRDLCVLSRKLFVVFDSFPGKVQRYLPMSKLHPAEKALSFIEARETTVLRKGWYVYRQALGDPETIIGRQPVFFFADLARAVATCCFNSLIDDDTRVCVHSSRPHITPDFIRRLRRELAPEVAAAPAEANNADLLEITRVRRLTALVNLTADPTGILGDAAAAPGAEASVFSYGPDKVCLVGSVSLIMVNSWNEVICNSYEGPDAVADLLRDMGRYFTPGAPGPDAVRVVDFSARGGDALIGPAVEKLIRLCLRTLSDRLLTSRRIEISGEEYFLRFNSRNMNIIHGWDVLEPNPIKAEVMGSSNANNDLVPSIIEANCMYGLIQYFFVKKDNGAYRVYNSMEDKELRIYDDLRVSVSDLVLDITGYYTHSLGRMPDEQDKSGLKYRLYFNLPQFFMVDVLRNRIESL